MARLPRRAAEDGIDSWFRRDSVYSRFCFISSTSAFIVGFLPGSTTSQDLELDPRRGEDCIVQRNG
jgi:hypothetical protein